MDTISTGVGDWKLTNPDDLEERTAEARRRAAGTTPLTAHGVRRLIVGNVTGLAELVEDGRVSDEELCEKCIALRGEPLSEVRMRRLARERARMWLYLSDGPSVPTTPDELLRFYEVANRSEPHFCTTIPARFRTAQDPLPFTLHSNHIDRLPLRPGFETVEGDKIPEAVEALLAFCARTDLPVEWVALASHFLVGRIHPFRDGNGHTARMLAASLLAPTYKKEFLLSFLAGVQECRSDLTRLQADVQLGRADLSDYVGRMLDQLSLASSRPLPSSASQ